MLSPQRKEKELKNGKYRCRCFKSVALPCNWAKAGYCGVDGKKCVVEEVRE